MRMPIIIARRRIYQSGVYSRVSPDFGVGFGPVLSSYSRVQGLGWV